MCFFFMSGRSCFGRFLWRKIYGFCCFERLMFCIGDLGVLVLKKEKLVVLRGGWFGG